MSIRTMPLPILYAFRSPDEIKRRRVRFDMPKSAAAWSVLIFLPMLLRWHRKGGVGGVWAHRVAIGTTWPLISEDALQRGRDTPKRGIR